MGRCVAARLTIESASKNEKTQSSILYNISNDQMKIKDCKTKANSVKVLLERIAQTLIFTL